MALTERCARHKNHNMYIDMYCTKHDDVGCKTCMADDNRSCQEDIFYIPEFLENNPTCSAPRALQQKLESASETLRVHHGNLQREKQRLLEKKTESLEDIRKFRTEINDRLDKLEKSTVTEIEDNYKILINKIEEAMKQLDTTKANVTSARDKIASTGGNISQNFVNAIKGESIAESADKCLEENKALTHSDDIDFIPDQRIHALLQEVNTFSSQATKVTGKTLPSAGRKLKYSPASNVQQNEALLQVAGSNEYSVKLQSDNENPYIVSACSLEDGTIILSDSKNNKLKRLDSSSYTVTDHCDLPGKPMQVCPIDTHQVAVCLPHKKEVKFIEVRNSMTITSKISTDFQCFGLAYAGDSLYISDYSTSVYMYSVQGMQFNKVQPRQAMFTDIRSLAVNEDCSRIYVTDWENGLITLDSNGQVVGTFNGPQLRYAWDSCLTGRGSLLVCGFASNNVLQFGLNGELIDEVIKSARKPQAICCNKQMSEIVIGRDWYNNETEVDVYYDPV